MKGSYIGPALVYVLCRTYAYQHLYLVLSPHLWVGHQQSWIQFKFNSTSIVQCKFHISSGEVPLMYPSSLELICSSICVLYLVPISGYFIRVLMYPSPVKLLHSSVHVMYSVLVSGHVVSGPGYNSNLITTSEIQYKFNFKDS